MWFAQISDMHVTDAGAGTRFSGDTGPRLARCVAALAAAVPPPDAVIATGDLVSAAMPAEYRRLRRLLAPLAMPLYVVPGNHDDREQLRAAFADHAYLPRSGPLCYGVDDFDVRFLVLDTVVAGEDGGRLDEAQLEWLDAQLERAPRSPTLLFMHHPPIATGMSRMDEIALDAGCAARLGAIVQRHPQVRRIGCGHVHRAVHAAWCGTVVSVCPSTAFQARVDFTPDGRFTATDEGPAYLAHHWDGGELATHTVSLPPAAEGASD